VFVECGEECACDVRCDGCDFLCVNCVRARRGVVDDVDGVVGVDAFPRPRSWMRRGGKPCV
jgi:hypothetical protein